MYLQVMMNLALVVVVILIYFFVTWKIKTIKSNKGESIEVISMLAVGPKEKLMLVRVENRKILVGATSNHISILSDFTADDNKELPHEVINEGSFKDVLNLASQKEVAGETS